MPTVCWKTIPAKTTKFKHRDDVIFRVLVLESECSFTKYVSACPYTKYLYLENEGVSDNTGESVFQFLVKYGCIKSRKINLFFFFIFKKIKFQKYKTFFVNYDIFKCYLLQMYIINDILYCPVCLRSFPLVVRFMRFISGRCSVHLPVYPFHVRYPYGVVSIYICVSPPLASCTRPLHLRFVCFTSGSCLSTSN